MLVLDLADFDTDLDQIQRLFHSILSPAEREALHSFNEYLVDERSTVSDEEINLLLDNGIMDREYSMTTDEFREVLQNSKVDRTELKPEEKQTQDAFMTILGYILLDKNKEDAIECQEEAVSDNLTIKLKVNGDLILDEFP